jgi:hypothetical protein
VKLFLPLLAVAPPSLPDLIVEQVIVSDATVQVTLFNRGDAPVTDAFWVDVYVSPRAAPQAANQIWENLGDQGLAWGVTSSGLNPGERLTLSVGDQYFRPQNSFLRGPIAVGTPIFAQVDSFNPSSTFGAVLETHERDGAFYNNISSVTAAVAIDLPPNSLQNRATVGDLLPPRAVQGADDARDGGR